MKKSYDCIVIGAGIVGVSTALSLARRNRKVLLIDKKNIAAETSYGNAGVIAVSSIIPLNNPSLYKSLVSLLKNNHLGFRYKSSYSIKNFPWLMRFLSYSQEKYLQPRASAINSLIKRSTLLHNEWLEETNRSDLIKHNGWLKLYQDEKSYQSSISEHACYKSNDVNFDVLQNHELKDFGSHLSKVNYACGTHFPQASHITDPQLAIKSYFSLFQSLGGSYLNDSVNAINSQSSDPRTSNIGTLWQIKTDNDTMYSENVIITAGPWSKKILESSKLKHTQKAHHLLPMAFENGAHYEFENSQLNLACPIYDTYRAFVVTPMLNRYRMTCGVFFANREDKGQNPLLNQIMQLAQNTLPLNQHNNKPWYGSRPTLPDSLPTIGQCDDKGLWLATGHQHIGLSTGPATGEIIAQQISDEKHNAAYTPEIINAFRVNRFL